MRILVVTVVHHPEDSRIRFREIAALLDGGWEVTYAAPFSGYGLPLESRAPQVRHVDVQRSQGRRRLGALRNARQVLEHEGPSHDLVLLHDPELLAALPGLKLPPVVWDVHEDTAAAVTLKPWLPEPLRPIVRRGFTSVERIAERRVHLILAEYAYQERFGREHLVVPNVTTVPPTVQPPDQPRAMYVGSLTHKRGVPEMIDAARIIHAKTDGEVRVTLVGGAHGDVESALTAAHNDGVLDWRGFLPNDQAHALLDGSMAGLVLLHDEPNYRISLSTKVTDYMAHGVPVVATPLPLQKQAVETADAGVVVPFNDAAAAADAVISLWNDPDARRRMGNSGHTQALEKYNWADHAVAFEEEMRRVAEGGPNR